MKGLNSAYWSGLAFAHPPGDLPNPGTEPKSLAYAALVCSMQLYLTLGALVGCNPPVFPVHGLLPARTLGLPFPLPGDLPGPGIESLSLASPALAGRFFTTAPPGDPKIMNALLLFRKNKL